MKFSIHVVLLLAFFSAVLLWSLSFLVLGLMISKFRQRAARLTAGSALAFSVAAVTVVVVFEADAGGIPRVAQNWLLAFVFALLIISVILAWKSRRASMARYGADSPDSLHGKHEIGTGR
jgi:hypothetical protein